MLRLEYEKRLFLPHLFQFPGKEAVNGIHKRNAYPLHFHDFLRESSLVRPNPQQINPTIQSFNQAFRTIDRNAFHKPTVYGIDFNLPHAFTSDGEIVLSRVGENIDIQRAFAYAVPIWNRVDSGQGIHAAHASDVALVGRQFDGGLLVDSRMSE